MLIILTAFLASTKILPQIDREALDLQARAEALQPRTHVSQPVARSVAETRIVRQAPPRPVVVQTVRQPIVRRASAGGPLDLASITTICRAAGEQDDPAGFIGRLSAAYSLSGDDRISLRASCAAYLAGRADARRAR